MTLDAAGQITNDGLNSYTWDDAGRLKTVSRGGQIRATYHYDDQDRLIAETTQTGTPLRSYAWSDENLIGQVEYVANATNTGYEIGRIVYYELDHLGTPRQARERTGTVVWRWESDGYGTTPADEDPDGNGQKTYVYLRFPGQYYDEESGLHYNWHRYYVPRLGRYLSSDPIGVVGGINTYGYVGGNPMRYTDPTGLVAGVDDAIVIGGTLAISACIATNCTKPIGQAMQSAANSLSSGINAIKEWCSDDGDKKDTNCTLRLLREVYYGGPSKTCVYTQQGAFGFFTFPQWKDFPCYPIDLEKCLVDTSTMDPALYGK